jgi:predicted dehydrogenase
MVCLGPDVETGSWQEMPVDPVQTNYQRFAGAVRSGVTQEPSFRHAANLQKVLDLAMVSDVEKKELPTH